MRTPQRRFGFGLIEHSQQKPAAYEFFQLVRLYERLFRQEEGSDPVSERIRFRNSVRLGFSPSQIDAMSVFFKGQGQDDDIEGIEITPGFIGMLGVSGTLPLHYTERVVARERGRDVAGRAFLDIFVNRAVGHFYRAWKKYKLPYLYETDRRNHFLPQLMSLLGLGHGALRERMSRKTGQIEDESLAYFAGLLRQRPVSATALKQVLSAYFQVDIAIEQFVGRWYEAPISQQSSLGGRNAALGVNTLLGERVWQRNLRIRIHIGALNYERYIAFLPKGELAMALARLLGFATGGQFECEVCPQLRASEVRPVVLGVSRGGRLGHDAFLRSRAESHDRTDLQFLVSCPD